MTMQECTGTHRHVLGLTSVQDFVALHAHDKTIRGAQVLERVCEKDMAAGGFSWIHTKSLYQLAPESRALLKGVTPSMCRTSEQPNGISALPRRASPAVSRSNAANEPASHSVDGL